MKILAVDPGHTCGIARISIRDGNVIEPPVTSVISVHPGHIYASLSHEKFDVVVVEEFRLYPWLATHQAYSELHTVEVIGVIKYLTAITSTPVYMQKATIKKEARHLGEQLGWTMVERSLGSGKGKYRGPDFDYPGQQHGRDALAHGLWWALRTVESPAYQG